MSGIELTPEAAAYAAGLLAIVGASAAAKSRLMKYLTDSKKAEGTVKK